MAADYAGLVLRASKTYRYRRTSVKECAQAWPSAVRCATGSCPRRILPSAYASPIPRMIDPKTAKKSNTKWIILGVVLGVAVLVAVAAAAYYILHVKYAVLLVRSHSNRGIH